MERITYATDGDLTLYPLSDDDRDNYFRLKLQVTDNPILYTNEELAEIMWHSAFDLSDSNFAVYKGSEYCGNIVLQNDGSDMPEIGIELLEHKRNMGIGPRAVKLLAQTYYADKPVEYFVLRVRRKNTHSRRMIEKLGCVYEGLQGDTTDEFIARIEKNLGKPLSDEFKENFIRNHDEGEDILIYKYYPDAFLDK